MEVRGSVLLDILDADVENTAVQVPKVMVPSASSDGMATVIDPEQVGKPRHDTVPTVHAASKRPVQIHEHANSSNTNKDWRNTINIPPEYSTCRTRFINKVKEYHEMWDVNLGQINTATHRVDLSSPEAVAIRAVPYHASSESARS